MTPILWTLKKGRNALLRTKLTLALIAASVLWLFIQIAMLIAVALTYGLDGASCSAMQYREPRIYGLSWLELYLIQCGFSYFGTMVFALLVYCVSSILKLRLAMPGNLVITLLTGQDMVRFCFAKPAYTLPEKLLMLSPAQLMASYPTLQIYLSYEFGSVIIQLPYMMDIAIVVEATLMLLFLHHREGGK